MRNLLAVLSVLLLSTAGNCNQPAELNGTTFSRLESLDGTGLNQSQLDEFAKHLKETSDTTGMIVLYDGKVAFEYGDIQEVSYIASCRKSVLSMLYGKHVHAGLPCIWLRYPL